MNGSMILYEGRCGPLILKNAVTFVGTVRQGKNTSVTQKEAFVLGDPRNNPLGNTAHIFPL